MTSRLLPFLLAALLTACHPARKASEAHSYQGEGVIERISADRHIATIHHQAIPGYMMEMTMDFPVHDAHLLDGYTPGDRIAFTLDVTDDEAWVAAARHLGHIQLPAAAIAPPAPAALKPGDPLPDAELTAEDGRPIHLSDFRGKVLVFTFFFTRCPLPNYCPLMNRNFAETRALLTAPGQPANWQFLSISFDSDFDTPQVLTGYADAYRHHDRDRWLFASATPQTLARLAAPLGLVIMRQGTNLSHNLRTIVVDPAGHLFRQFNDNLWTPGQLAQAVREATAAPKPSASASPAP